MAISPSTRYKVLERDKFKCQLCGKSPPQIELEVDHIVPKAEKGRDNIENLRSTCKDCNRGRGTLVEKGISSKDLLSPQDMPLPWFGCEHGIDNYEDLVRLDEIQTIKFVWRSTIPGYDDRSSEGPFNQAWDIICYITFKNKAKYEIRLNKIGYNQFLSALKQVQSR
jgi:hypothetical protein